MQEIPSGQWLTAAHSLSPVFLSQLLPCLIYPLSLVIGCFFFYALSMVTSPNFVHGNLMLYPFTSHWWSTPLCLLYSLSIVTSHSTSPTHSHSLTSTFPCLWSAHPQIPPSSVHDHLHFCPVYSNPPFQSPLFPVQPPLSPFHGHLYLCLLYAMSMVTSTSVFSIPWL